MATGVAAVWLPVTDMDRAVAFYRDVLGLPITMQEEDWSEVDAGGVKLGLNAREEATGGSRAGRSSASSPTAASTTRCSD